MDDFVIDKRMPYYEQCYYTIKKMIFNGMLEPGDRLNETQLAKDFNVSKSPVREAIRILEKEGLLVVDHSGVVVFEPTIEDIKEIYQCRMALESFAVSLTTELAQDIELNELEKKLAETEQAILENQDSNTIITLNSHFHSLIVEFSRNHRLRKQIEDIRGLIYYFRVLNFKGDDRARTIVEQHRRIFSLMKDRKAELASKEMVQHLQHDIDHLLEILKSHNENQNSSESNSN
ncbi:GntR family transcriptional regulator [Salibacterium aidingense]|uniref:GntR family transcriptional regulator n=1 Tax=Salibacterium aidingense TaxID=384933 RepID=UPI0003FD700C|nr:GntR family transcriptional regulator [Salibacterium aidingense]